MILAEKIINERKKNGWSQEELAEMLDVSRQSVSKWESAQSVPDLSKILKLAEIFSVSTDYLLKDEIELSEAGNNTETSNNYDEKSPLIKVSMEEANDFISISKGVAGKVATAVSLCVISPVALILLSGLLSEGILKISEGAAVILGLCILFGLVAIAVFIFVTTGAKLKKYEYIKTEDFETAYGVSGMVKEKKKDFEGKYIVNFTTGIIIFVLCALPIIIPAVVTENGAIISSMVCVTLVLVAIGVNLVIRVGTVMNAYKALLMEDEYSKKEKENQKKFGPIMGAFWMIIVALYLTVSFVTGRWDYSWIVWPVAGILFGAIGTIIKGYSKNQ